MRDQSDTSRPRTLVQNIYDCLDDCLRVNGKLTSNEIGIFNPPRGDNPANTTGNEKLLIYRLCRLLYKEGGSELPVDAFLFPPGHPAKGAKLIPQIAGLYEDGTPGKRPYHQVMDEAGLRVYRDFAERIMQAYGNPEYEGRLNWPELKTNPAFYAGLMEAIADFKREMGYDPPSRNSLYKAIYDPAVADKPITEEHQKYEKAESVGAPARPMVVYFGGMISPSEQPEFINRAMRRIKRTLDPALIPTDQYDIYVTTYNNRASLRKIQYILQYMQDPEHFSSPMAKEIVARRLRPLYAQQDGDGHWQRLDRETLLRHMSLVTFMGYSYGTSFIQEARNAMADDMEALGYPPQDIRDGLKAIAALNVGPAVSVTDKSARGNFTQLFAAAEGDTASAYKSNIPELVASDPHPHLKQYRMETGGGLSAVAVMGMHVPARLPSYRTRSLFNKGELKDMHVHTAEATMEQDNESRHHIESFLRSTHLRPDDDTLTIGINPVAETVRAFLQQQMLASIAVAGSRQPYRDAPKVLAQVAEEHLNPDAIDLQVQRTRRINARLRQETEDRHLHSTRRPR